MADVEVLPADLKFRFQLNKQLLGTITINNPHDKRVAYKIKTTAPKKYVVRPSSGIADAKSSVNVQVIMQAQKEYPPDFANCKDKFMVQTVAMSDDDQLDKDTFTKEGHKDLKEARLRVILDGPAAPPSPVAEVNEHGEGEDGGAPVAHGRSGDAADASRIKSTLGELSAVSSENGTLRAQLANVVRDRDELRRRLDQSELRGGGKGGGGGGGAHGGGSGGVAVKSSISILHLILVAIIAFLLGHYT